MKSVSLIVTTLLFAAACVLAVLVAACSKSKPAANSEGPAAPAKVGAGGACDDATIKAAVDRGYAIEDAYFAAVNKIRWTADCKDVEADLKAAVPAAAKYSEDTKAFRRETMPDQPCGREIVEASNKDPRNEVVGNNFKKMLEASAPADERCSDKVAGWRGLHDGVVGAVGGAY
jgi:hypothetical protein